MKAEAKDGKKQRQSQSCDACRARKVKCSPIAPAQDPSSSTAPGTEGSIQDCTVQGDNQKPTTSARLPCKQCLQLGIECLYLYRPRKRGPPNLYLRRLSEAQKNGQSFHNEVESGTAEASSRAIEEKRKGKGKEGHELKHIREEDKNGDEGGMDYRWTAEDMSNDTARPPLHSHHAPSHHTHPPSHRMHPENNNTTSESFVRTSLPDSNSRLPVENRPRYSQSTAVETGHIAGPAISEDPFTPSQFMNLDADAQMNFSTTPIDGRLSPQNTRLASHHSRMEGYASGLPFEMPYEATRKTSFTANASAQHPTISNSARPSLSTGNSSGLGEQSSNPAIKPETAYPAVSPQNHERARTYYTSPSDADSNFGLVPSHYPGGAPFPSILPEHSDNKFKGRGSLDVSLSGHVDRDFLLQPSATNSTIAVHGDPSTGGTDAQVGLPIHTLTSRTLGEVGAPYLYNRVKDGNGPLPHQGHGPYGESPPNDLLGDSKNGVLIGESGITGPHLRRQPYHHAMNVNPLDALIPRPLLHHIINLFFDYVYPLTPCLHKPTFIQDLARQREMEPGQGEWTALVLATVMSTLVQVPRAFVPLTRREVKDLAYRCHVAGRTWSLQGYKDFTVNAVIIRYFVYNYVRGEIATCHTSLCEAQALATVLRLHEEETYTYLNPIEREVRRRIFFLLFQADKSESVLSGRPIRMREEECYSLRLPEELDDDYITETRYLQQPEGMTSVITGFNASIRIHCLGGRAITKHKEDKRDPPTGVRLQRRLEEVSRMLDEVTNIMKDCPPQLRLREGLDSRVQSPAGGWDVEASAKLQAFFFDPQASREHARNAFLVQQGNCFVTKACVTFVLLQYQNDLLHLKAATSLNNSLRPSNGFKPIGGLPLGGISTSEQPGKESTDYVAASKESLYYDLLSILHSLPIQCIAVNGPALVNCVRYVASGLLDTVQLKAEDNGNEDAGIARAQNYLIDFLSILSDIEKNYSLDDDE